MDVIKLLERRQAWLDAGIQTLRFQLQRYFHSKEVASCDIHRDVTVIAVDGTERSVASDADVQLLRTLLPSLADFATSEAESADVWPLAGSEDCIRADIDLLLNVDDLRIAGTRTFFKAEVQRYDLPASVLASPLAQRLSAEGRPERFEIYASGGHKEGKYHFRRCMQEGRYVRCGSAPENFSEAARTVVQDELARLNRELAAAVQHVAEETGLDPSNPDILCRIELSFTVEGNQVLVAPLPSIVMVPYVEYAKEVEPISVLSVLDCYGGRDITWLDDAMNACHRLGALAPTEMPANLKFVALDHPDDALAYLRACHDRRDALRPEDVLARLLLIVKPGPITDWQRLILDVVSVTTPNVTLEQVNKLVQCKSYGIVANKSAVLTPEQIKAVFMPPKSFSRRRSYIYEWEEESYRTTETTLMRDWERQTQLNRWLYSHVRRVGRHIQAQAELKAPGWQQRHSEQFRDFVDELISSILRSGRLQDYRLDETTHQLERLRELPVRLVEALLSRRNNNYAVPNPVEERGELDAPL